MHDSDSYAISLEMADIMELGESAKGHLCSYASLLAGDRSSYGINLRDRRLR